MSTVDATHAGSTAARIAGAPVIAANYQYWRDHGAEWGEGYESRKKRSSLYHIQELMLVEYVLHYLRLHQAANPGATFRVLEFGCGPGRHLRNLSRIAGLDVSGFDQSASMASGVMRWADPEWFDAHIHVGDPVGRLPFDDGSFDLVYSTEVLVHVRPADLPHVLGEMSRVSRGHVLHMETSPNAPLCTTAHDGCWYHDLPEVYAALHRPLETLGAGYIAHTMYRSAPARDDAFAWHPLRLEMFRHLERDMEEGFGVLERKLADADRRVQELGQEIKAKDERIAQMTAEVAAITAKSVSTAKTDELTAKAAMFEARSQRTSETLMKVTQAHDAMRDAMRDATVRDAAVIQDLGQQVKGLREQIAREVEAAAKLRVELSGAEQRIAELTREAFSPEQQAALELRASQSEARQRVVEHAANGFVTQARTMLRP